MKTEFSPRIWPYAVIIFIFLVFSILCLSNEAPDQKAYEGQIAGAVIFGGFAFLLLGFQLSEYELVSITDDQIEIKGIFSKNILLLRDINTYRTQRISNPHISIYESLYGASIKSFELFMKNGDVYSFSNADYNSLDEMIDLVIEKMNTIA